MERKGRGGGGDEYAHASLRPRVRPPVLSHARVDPRGGRKEGRERETPDLIAHRGEMAELRAR